ncbi:MAG: hypothetical protein HND48_03060 [Chloroflexi bacterium]|nr:hypothetical protein [Chloroflexota bacterium]
MSEQQSDLRRRALGAILANALRSPQFLFTIAFTLALYVFVGDNISVPLFDWQSQVLAGRRRLGGARVPCRVRDRSEAAQEAVNRMFEQKLRSTASRTASLASISRRRLNTGSRCSTSPRRPKGR